MKMEKEWTPESFPKPQTFPSGWDGWALNSTNGHYVNEERKLERAECEDETNWSPEKFPKPKTFPKNWSIDD